MITPEQKQDIINSVHQAFPDWGGFASPAFVKEEVHYKHQAVTLMHETLGADEMQRLMAAGQEDEIIQRLGKVGRKTNLLFQTAPLEGDLNILHVEIRDKPAFCRQVFDLLHGQSPSPERLAHYAAYVESQGYPNRWTFPTYLLFLCHPESEMLVKPRITAWLFQYLGMAQKLSAHPTAESYQTILDIVEALKTALAEYHPRDMVDIQSLIWILAEQKRKQVLSQARQDEFESLFTEYIAAYVNSPAGKIHVASYELSRTAGRANFEAVCAAAERGEDITDRVLLKLLPYKDTQGNRAHGAWINVAPSITKDVKQWFEGAGWTKPADWPLVSQAILDFVQRCVKEPNDLASAIQNFAALPYSKGFQTGMLTPILNALRPQDYITINNKSRQLANYFSEKSFSQRLVDYPEINATALKLIAEMGPALQLEAYPDLLPGDVLDMFSHWLVAVKKYNFEGQHIWKIAPGDNAGNWDNCREGGYIAIGWDELGDVSKMQKADFNARKEELLAAHPDWGKDGTEQVWKLAHVIREGDRIIANRGTQEVVGIGTVNGPYYFVPNERYGHRLPVEWEDTAVRRVDQQGWRRTLIELDAKDLQGILAAPTSVSVMEGELAAPTRVGEVEGGLAAPFNQMFASLEEAQWAFARLAEAAARLQITGPTDPMAAFNLRRIHGNHVLRLSYAAWLVLEISGRGGRLESVMLTILAEPPGLQALAVERFAQTPDEPAVELQTFPIETIRSDQSGLWERYLQTLDFIKQRFENWSGSQFHHRSKLALAQAVFDPQRRAGLLSQENPAVVDSEPQPQPVTPLAQIAAETGFAQGDLERWVRAIRRKGQAILYGPPGTGKTFLAEKLARHLIGGGDGFIELIQFHPSYSYEEFIAGIRPQPLPGGGLHFPVVPGRFLKFCQLAQEHSGPCVLIIDEINRANLSRVFGELMYLLEYRTENIPLASGEMFAIPQNVHLIGTMNTADRSIALVDHALRRRFAFLEVQPNYEALRRYHQLHQTGFAVEGLIGVLQNINREINDRHYEVGISFFMREELADEIQDIWEMEILPYLREFFFDHPERAEAFEWAKVATRILMQ